MMRMYLPHVVPPIVVPSIVPPSISALVKDADEIVIEPIVPPSIESPEIWSLASVNVPADKSAVSVAPMLDHLLQHRL